MEDRERKPPEEEEIDLYELWLRLVKRKKIIGGVFLTGILTALAISFIMKPVYRSEASLLPVASQPSAGFSELAGQFLGIQLSRRPDGCCRNTEGDDQRIGGQKNRSHKPERGA